MKLIIPGMTHNCQNLTELTLQNLSTTTPSALLAYSDVTSTHRQKQTCHVRHQPD